MADGRHGKLVMRFAFRTDASTEIGSGHVVRCASLAAALLRSGHEIQFICRELNGDLNSWLDGQGLTVNRIFLNEHATELEDAQATARRLSEWDCDWLILDHYGLGFTWEQAMAGAARRIFVIDDLARRHDCDLLLDQNYGNRWHGLYENRVPETCGLLLGAEFALVRPEFSRLRATSLERRDGRLARLLVFMGGSDPVNETSKVLDGLQQSGRPDLAVDVVIGSGNPYHEAVKRACSRLPAATLHVQTNRMARLMASADCAIGSPGSASWERCTLGLPAMVTILAENQMASAEALAVAGAHHLLGRHDRLTPDDYARALGALDPASLARMSSAAAAICDGKGTERVAARLAAAPKDSARVTSGLNA